MQGSWKPYFQTGWMSLLTRPFCPVTSSRSLQKKFQAQFMSCPDFVESTFCMRRFYLMKGIYSFISNFILVFLDWLMSSSMGGTVTTPKKGHSHSRKPVARFLDNMFYRTLCFRLRMLRWELWWGKSIYLLTYPYHTSWIMVEKWKVMNIMGSIIRCDNWKIK